MNILFSRACEYALQSVLYLATQANGKPALQRDIARVLQIPQHFLGKILQQLVRSNIVLSLKGKSGGFLLARPPKDIMLIEIVQAIDGDRFLEHCVIGFPGCADTNPCPLHPKWSRAKAIILDMLKNENVLEIGKEIKPKLDFLQANAQQRK